MVVTGGGHGRRFNSDAAAAVLLAVLLANLAVSTHCTGTRQQLRGVARGGSSGGTAVAVAGHEDGDESKIYLIFCQKSKCVDDGHDYTCYCCLHWASACWTTMEGCRRSCPVCDPKCHPPLPVRRLPRSTVSPVAGVYGKGAFGRSPEPEREFETDK